MTAGPPSGLALARARLLGPPVVRRAARRRTMAAALAGVVGLAVLATVRDAERTREVWGATRPVAVATRSLDAGAVLGRGDVRVVRLPTAAVPPAALPGPPLGRRLRDDVGRGEPLTDARLVRRATGATGAVLEPGRVAATVELPAPGATPAPGDRVDVWAAGRVDPLDGIVGRARRVAAGATVLAVAGRRTGDGGWVPTGAAAGGAPTAVLAVRSVEAGAVASAALAGPVAVVVLP